MLKLFSRLGKAQRPEIRDGQNVYRRLMAQSRRPEFYGEQMVPDTMDGRMEMLCLHLAHINKALMDKNEQGQRLMQGIYDVMVDDFDIALREEGLSDTGVKRRIKPMVGRFYARAKAISDALDDEAPEQAMQAYACANLTADKGNAKAFARYSLALAKHFAQLELGEIACGAFDLPDFS